MVELIWEQHGVVRRLWGPVGDEELDSSAIALQANEHIDNLRHIIHDFSGVTQIEIPQHKLEFMAVRASVALNRNPVVKIAFVGNHPVVNQLIDAFNNKGISSLRCHRFDTLEEARAFVSVT